MFRSALCSVLIAISATHAAWVHALSPEEMDAMAREIKQTSDAIMNRQVREEMPELLSENLPQAPAEDGRRIFVFVSWSMGDEGTRAVIEQLADREDVTLVFRGIPDGMSMADAIQKMAKFAGYGEGRVSLTLDPPRFTKYAVDVVPTILMEEGDQAVVQARGITSPEYLEAALAEGKSGDLGLAGQTVTIAEPDLIDVMKARAAKLDMEEMKRGAHRRFWANQQFHALPRATDSATRLIDPTVVSAVAMYDANGQLLYPAGAKVNPLEMVPFKQRLVIFNPTIKAEISFAEDQLKQHGDKQRVTLIATEFERDETADFMTALVGRLGVNVYLLTPEVQSRFELRFSPSVVTADSDRFRVEEFRLNPRP